LKSKLRVYSHDQLEKALLVKARCGRTIAKHVQVSGTVNE